LVRRRFQFQAVDIGHIKRRSKPKDPDHRIRRAPRCFGEGGVTGQTLIDVERHLTVVPRNAREIWGDINCWAYTTVKQRLDELAEQGKIIKSSEPYRYGGTRSMYRRADLPG
jgi:hypothetical protein